MSTFWKTFFFANSCRHANEASKISTGEDPLTVDAPGTRQSRSCGLEQGEGAEGISGVVAVGGGDVAVAVEPDQTDRQAA